jgi:hypothetical protein
VLEGRLPAQKSEEMSSKSAATPITLSVSLIVAGLVAGEDVASFQQRLLPRGRRRSCRAVTGAWPILVPAVARPGLPLVKPQSATTKQNKEDTFLRSGGSSFSSTSTSTFFLSLSLSLSHLPLARRIAFKAYKQTDI